MILRLDLMNCQPPFTLRRADMSFVSEQSDRDKKNFQLGFWGYLCYSDGHWSIKSIVKLQIFSSRSLLLFEVRIDTSGRHHNPPVVNNQNRYKSFFISCHNCPSQESNFSAESSDKSDIPNNHPKAVLPYFFLHFPSLCNIIVRLLWTIQIKCIN